VQVSPCGTVAPARMYDAGMSELTQDVAASKKDPEFVFEVSSSKKEASVVPAWACPVFSVLAMFCCSACIAIKVRRGRRSDVWTLLKDDAEDMA